MIKLIVFDLDGTIADSKATYLESIQIILSKYGHKFSQKQISDALGPKLRESLLNLKKFKAPVLRKICNEINSHVESLAPGIKPAHYAAQVLRSISGGRKHSIILMTNSTHKFAHNFLHNVRLEEYFDQILGAENFKNKVTAFHGLFKEFKVTPEETLYVGDKTSDYLIAQEVKCHVLLTHTCSWDKDKISKAPYKEFLVEDLRGIVKLVTKI